MVTQTVSVPHHETQLAELGRALEHRRDGRGPERCSHAGEATVTEQAEALSAVTRQCFPPGILSIAEEQDPEDPANAFLVLDVQAVGDFAQIERQCEAWQSEVRRIFPDDSSWLRLCVYPR